MEERKRPSYAPQKKQVVVNIGKVSTRGGGGIGGVILLGGALATAAFASAFIIGRNRRGGSRDNSQLNNHTPPPPAAVDKKDEANEREQYTVLDADKQSSQTTKEIEFKNDGQSLVLSEKHRIEINGVAVCDSETTEQVLCSIIPKRPENGAICNGGVPHLPAQEQKTLWPLEIENTTVHDPKIQSAEAAIDENGIAKDLEEVEAEGEGKDDGEIEEMGEIHEATCEDAKESNGNHLPETGSKSSEEGTFGLEHCEDGQESNVPVVENHIIKRENVNDDDKQNVLSSEGAAIIHDGEAIHQDKEDQLEHIEEHLVQEHEKRSAPDEEIVLQKGEEEKEDHQSEEKIEEKGYIDNSTPENRRLGEESVQILVMHLPEDEPISPEEIEVSEDAVNGEIDMSLCQHKDTEAEVEKNIENEVEDSSETVDIGIATAKDTEDIFDGTDGDEDLSDEEEQNTEGTVDNSTESNFRAILPAEAIQEPSMETQQEKLVNQEIEGKSQEDATVKRGKYELHYKNVANTTHFTTGKCNSVKTFIERYAVDLATLKDYSTNSGTRKALLVAIPVLSSVSCSWFFGLTFDKFCFVVLLTIVLSKSMIVK